jgi:tetratricopeptide (TPR) repeat protein
MRRESARLFWGTSAAALVVRAAHVLTLPGTPLFTRPLMDAAVHDVWARGLLAGTWPGAEPFFRAPGYPFFLGILYGVLRLFGLDPGEPGARLATVLVQALISALGAGFVALCAERAWNRRAGWLAGGIFAALWTSIYFAGELLFETLVTTLALWLVWRLLRDDGEGAATPRAAGLLGTGLVAGLGVVTRPSLLVLVPVIIFYLRRGRGLRWRSLGWAALATGLLLPILPVTLHNVVRGHDAVLIATQGGVNFWIGNNPQSDGRTAIVPGTRATWQGGYEDAIALAEREAGHRLRPSQVDAHYLGKGLAFIAREPGRAALLTARKLRLLLAAGERGNNNNPYFWRRWSPVLRWPIWLGWAPVLALATVGFWRRDLARPRRTLLLGVAVVYAASVLVFFVNGRFRLPLLALLAAPAGAGLERIFTGLRTRRWPDGLAGPLLATGLLAFSASDLLTFRENRVDADVFSRFTLGNALADNGDLDGARRAYEDALAVQRRFRLTQFGLIAEPLYTSLGRIYQSQQRTADALTLCTEWVRAQPATITGRVMLGELLFQAGRTAEAAAQFEVALRTAPDDQGAQLGHAWILRANGDTGAALRRFRGLADGPSGVQALFGVGLCLMDLQRWGEAEQTFREVLRRQPDYWQALGNLAAVYDQSGRQEEARRACEELVARRPGDPQASRWLAEHPR